MYFATVEMPWPMVAPSWAQAEGGQEAAAKRRVDAQEEVGGVGQGSGGEVDGREEDGQADGPPPSEREEDGEAEGREENPEGDGRQQDPDAGWMQQDLESNLEADWRQDIPEADGREAAELSEGRKVVVGWLTSQRRSRSSRASSKDL